MSPRLSSLASCSHPFEFIGICPHTQPFVRRAGEQTKPVAVVVLSKAGAVTAHKRVIPADRDTSQHMERVPAVPHQRRDFIHATAICVTAYRLALRVTYPTQADTIVPVA